MLKKLLVSVLVGISLLFSLGSNFTALAAEPSDDTGNTNTTTSTNTDNAVWYNQTFPEWYGKAYDKRNPGEIFGERYTAAQVQWVLYGMISSVFNLIPGMTDIMLCATNADVGNCINIAVAGSLSSMNINSSAPTSLASNKSKNLISEYFNTVSQSPLSGIGYLNNLSNKLSPVSHVKAAESGYGFLAGQSMVGLWTITRNISYSFLVLAIVVIAFMIMFRVKINPQTVISIQSALPKLVVTLVLITFSYAIAGFIIDLMYVVIGLFAAIASTSGLSDLPAPDLFANLIGQYNGFTILYTYWVHFVASAFQAIFVSGSRWFLGIFVFVFAIFTIIPILWWSIKIIYVMVKNFAMLMITIAIGPLEIMLGAVTNKFGFGSWLKQIVSYVAVYPVLTIMMFFSFFFLRQGIESGVTGTGSAGMPFEPVKNVIGINTWNPPFSLGTGEGGTLVMWVLVSFFIFSQITKVTDLVQSFFSGKPFDYGSAIGEATGAVKSAWGSTGAPYLKTAQEVYSRARLNNWSNKLIDKFNNKKNDKTKT